MSEKQGLKIPLFIDSLTIIAGVIYGVIIWVRVDALSSDAISTRLVKLETEVAALKEDMRDLKRELRRRQREDN